MYDYKDKFNGVEKDGRNSVYQILSQTTFQDWETIKKDYDATAISEIKIDGNTFKNYGQYQFIWEKSFVKSPQRSSSGSIGNLNSYTTFLTPHLLINFSIMSIDDYRALMKLHYSKNEFTVECYDFIYKKPITVKMYFGTEEMAKLYTINKMRQKSDGEWEDWIELVGVQDYTVELIGTNNDVELVSVRYVYNSDVTPSGAPMPDQYEEDVYVGDEIVLGKSSTFPDTPPSNTLKFKEWRGDDGLTYRNGTVITVNSKMIFYAVWEGITDYTLSFNYGLSEVATDTDENGILYPVLNRSVKLGESIGKLPPLTDPYVELGENKKRYYPFENGGWYKYPIKQEDMKVEDNTNYWIPRDDIIYALYDKKKYTVTYNLSYPEGTLQKDRVIIEPQSIEYGGSVVLPIIKFFTYKLDVWYIDNEYTTKFSGTMPPYDITIYGRFRDKFE